MKQGSVRYFALLLLLFLLPVLLLSCGEGSGKVLLGRWETEIVDEELGKVSMVYHFTEEGEIFLEQKSGDAIPFSIPFGTWSAEGDQVTIESDGAEDVFTFSVSEKELILSRQGEEDLVFRKV